MNAEDPPPDRNAEQSAQIESQRRQRSLFALIGAIIRRSSAESVEDYKAHLNGRLDALVRLHAMTGRGGRVDLALIVAEELLAQGLIEGQGLVIEGPSVDVSTQDAQTLGLAFHELATNAVKFGDLPRRAEISVIWTRRGNVLHLEWREASDRQEVAVAGPAGFGTAWLTETLPYELAAVVDFEIGASGVVCSMDFPLR